MVSVVAQSRAKTSESSFTRRQLSKLPSRAIYGGVSSLFPMSTARAEQPLERGLITAQVGERN